MNRPEDYVKSSNLQVEGVRYLIEEFSDEIKEMNGKCLDIGCGPGTTTRNILLPSLPSDSHVVGADISARMIEYAKTIHSDEKRLSFIELDIETDKIPTDQISTYDNALSFYCLHWCQNPRKTFENIHQMLRPGGKLLIIFIARSNLFAAYLNLSKNPLYKSYMQDIQRFICSFYHNNNPRASLKKILEETGFKSFHCSFREKTFIFENADEMMKHALTLTPFLDRIPKNMRMQFEKDFQYELLNRMNFFRKSEDNSKMNTKILNIYNILIAYCEKSSN